MLLKSLRFFLLVAGLFLLSACNPLKPIKSQQVNYYSLSSVANVKSARRTNTTIMVAQPTANPAYQSSQMIYTVQPYQLRAFVKNEWVATPAQMFLPLLLQSLRNSNHFKAVLAPPITALTQYRLSVQILWLRQSFISNPSVVSMGVQATLINAKTSQVVAAKRFTSKVATTANNPQAGVIAANKANKQILTQLVKFVVRAI